LKSCCLFEDSGILNINIEGTEEILPSMRNSFAKNVCHAILDFEIIQEDIVEA